MKFINLNKIRKIPVAYLLFIGVMTLVLIWTSCNVVSIDRWPIKNTDSTSFLIFGMIGGFAFGRQSSSKRLEIGAAFFSLIGTGIVLIILSSHNSKIFHFLFGFYAIRSLTIPTLWIIKNEKFSWAKWIGLTLLSLVVALLLLLGIGADMALKTGGFFAWIVALIALISMPSQIARYLVVAVSRIIFRLKPTNLHNLPKSGGALLVSNHVSFLDFVILAGAIPRNIRFVMHQGIFDNLFLKPILTKLNMIPISPRGGKNNLEKFNKRCQKEINNGHVVLIFAEGTVTRNGQTLPFKKGVEYIAKGISAPIIPINLEGVLGTPLSFTREKTQAIMPTIKNIGKKIFITIGNPMTNTTSVFSIRQKILELGVKSFKQRVKRRASLGKWILSIDNKKQLIQDSDGNWVNGRSIKNKSLAIALKLKNTLKDEKKVAILHRNDINFNLFVYALSLLGKEIIVLNPKLSKKDNQQILKQLHVSVCINGIGKSSNPCVGYIGAKNVIKNRRVMEIIIARLMLSLPSFAILKTLNNKQGKYSHAVTFARISDNLVHGSSMTNTMIFAESIALHQIHLTSNYGTILSLHSPFSSLGFYLEVLVPATLQIQSSKGDFSSANTVIGFVDDIENVFYKIKNKGNIKNILMDNQPIKSNLLEQFRLVNINYYQGFGIHDLTPIVAVNTPDFVGKDIVGIPLTQESNNPASVGRPIPSIAVRIIKDTTEMGVNEWGKIWIKGASISKQFVVDPCGEIINNCLEWIDTNVIGMIDEKGFLIVKQLPLLQQ